jgi:hypothetical protein
VSAIIKPRSCVFSVRPWIHDSWCTTGRWIETCSRNLFCFVSSTPKLHKCLWKIQTMGHGTWASSLLAGFLRSSGQPCSVPVPVSVFTKPHLTEKASTQIRGTFLQLLPLIGLAAIATGQAGAAYGHSQSLVIWAHCDITNKHFLIVETV